MKVSDHFPRENSKKFTFHEFSLYFWSFPIRQVLKNCFYFIRVRVCCCGLTVICFGKLSKFLFTFEWVTSRPRCRPQLTRTNYNLPFFFYRNDCLILVFKSSTNYFFFVRKMSEKSGAGTKLWACLHVNQNKRVNFLIHRSFFAKDLFLWKRKTSMGRKSINYISIPVEVNPPNDSTAMKNEYKDWIEILLPSAIN